MIKRLAGFLVFALMALALGGCITLNPAHYQTFAAAENVRGEYKDLPLASGQIVVSGSASPMDMALGLMPSEFSPYIHMGILVVDDGVPYVYESLGDPTLNFDKETPPTATIEGAVSRAPFVRFVNRYLYVEVYEPKGADPEMVADFARKHYAAKTPFDKFFDYNDAESFYCAEFVGRGLEYGGYPRLQPASNRRNASVNVLMDWLQVPQETLSVEALINGGERVLLISRVTEVEIMLLNEVKRELYRRFTADQKLGNVFRWEITRPALRFPVERFYVHSMELSDGLEADPVQVAAAVREVANEWLGEFEPAAGR